MVSDIFDHVQAQVTPPLSPPPTSPHAAYLPTNQFFYYFLLIYISFYISRYHFCNFLELHLTLSEKRFLSEFSFITHNSP